MRASALAEDALPLMIHTKTAESVYLNAFIMEFCSGLAIAVCANFSGKMGSFHKVEDEKGCLMSIRLDCNERGCFVRVI